MKLTIEIEIAGAAFFPEEYDEQSDAYDAALEVHRILVSALADGATERAVVEGSTVPLFDLNGNRVGAITLDNTDPPAAGWADRMLVVNDVHQSYPELDDLEALRHAWDTLALSDIYDDTDLATAYRRVLRGPRP